MYFYFNLFSFPCLLFSFPVSLFLYFPSKDSPFSHLLFPCRLFPSRPSVFILIPASNPSVGQVLMTTKETQHQRSTILNNILHYEACVPGRRCWRDGAGVAVLAWRCWRGGAGVAVLAWRCCGDVMVLEVQVLFPHRHSLSACNRVPRNRSRLKGSVLVIWRRSPAPH